MLQRRNRSHSDEEIKMAAGFRRVPAGILEEVRCSGVVAYVDDFIRVEGADFIDGRLYVELCRIVETERGKKSKDRTDRFFRAFTRNSKKRRFLVGVSCVARSRGFLLGLG